MKFTTIALFSTAFAAAVPSSTGSADSSSGISIFTPEEVQILAEIHGKSVNETIAHFNLENVYVYQGSGDSTDSSASLGKRSFYYNQLSRWGRMRW